MDQTPKALNELLVRILTVNGEKREVEWSRLRDLLVLAEKAGRSYDPSKDDDGKVGVSRKTIDLFLKFMTSKAGLFLKEPLVHELAEAIDGMASMGESNLARLSGGFVWLPGGNGPINSKKMAEMKAVLTSFSALLASESGESKGEQGREQIEMAREIVQSGLLLFSDKESRELTAPILRELASVIQLVAVEVLEIRSSRAIRGLFLKSHAP